jgi:hypothetical protein
MPALIERFRVEAATSLSTRWRLMDKAELAYDPSDREPRTFAEWKTWMSYWVFFSNPRRSGLRPPTIARNADHHYLECYCKETFGGFDIDTLGKLHGRYLLQTGKTVEQIDATTLHELAEHFRGHAFHTNTGNQGSDENADRDLAGLSKPRAKASTRNGDGRAKLIAALTTHHKYADNSCLNPAPISNNELARLAGVARSTASAFIRKKFPENGHAEYQALCRRDPGGLLFWLRELNDDLPIKELLYSRLPHGEGGLDDDE